MIVCCQDQHTGEVLHRSFLVVNSTRETESERDLLSVCKINASTC